MTSVAAPSTGTGAGASGAEAQIRSLLSAGASAGLQSLGAALALELDGGVPPLGAELVRAGAHMTSLGSELVRFEKATRLLQALIKGKEETDGQGPSLFATLAASIQQQQQGDTTTPNAAHAAHDAGVLRLREQQRVSAAALQEIQTNFEELRTNNKEDIQNLLHKWSAVETSTTALEHSRKAAGAAHALAAWESARTLWSSMETALLAAEDVSSSASSSTNMEEIALANQVLEEALKDVQAGEQTLVRVEAENMAPSTALSEVARKAAAEFPLQTMTDLPALQAKQRQALVDVRARNQALQVSAAQEKGAARTIHSFPSALAEATAACAPTDPALRQLRKQNVACTVLSKLSGVALLARAVEDHQIASGSVLDATRFTLLLRAPLTQAQEQEHDAALQSDEAFARLLEAQQAEHANVDAAANNNMCIVLSVLAFTPAQAAEAARAAGLEPAPLAGEEAAEAETSLVLRRAVLLSAKATGTLPGNSLASFHAETLAGPARGAQAARNLIQQATTRAPSANVQDAVLRATQRAMHAQQQFHLPGVENLLAQLTNACVH